MASSRHCPSQESESRAKYLSSKQKDAPTLLSGIKEKVGEVIDLAEHAIPPIAGAFVINPPARPFVARPFFFDRRFDGSHATSSLPTSSRSTSTTESDQIPTAAGAQAVFAESERNSAVRDTRDTTRKSVGYSSAVRDTRDTTRKSVGHSVLQMKRASVAEREAMPSNRGERMGKRTAHGTAPWIESALYGGGVTEQGAALPYPCHQHGGW